MAGYAEDLHAAMKAQTEFIKKQVMLEVIQVAATCETYEEFRKAMYGKALEFMKELEALISWRGCGSTKLNFAEISV